MIIRFSLVLLSVALNFSGTKFVNAMQQGTRTDSNTINVIIEEYFDHVRGQYCTKFNESIKDELIQILHKTINSSEKMAKIRSAFQYYQVQNVVVTMLSLPKSKPRAKANPLELNLILDFFIKVFENNKIIIKYKQKFSHIVKTLNNNSYQVSDETDTKIAKLVAILQKLDSDDNNNASTPQKRMRDDSYREIDNRAQMRVILPRLPFAAINNNKDDILNKNKQRRIDEAFKACSKIKKFSDQASQLFSEHQAQDITLFINDTFLRKMKPEKGNFLLKTLNLCLKENNPELFIINLLFRIIDTNQEYKNIDKNAVFNFVKKTIQQNDNLNHDTIKQYLEKQLKSVIPLEESVKKNIDDLITILQEKIIFF